MNTVENSPIYQLPVFCLVLAISACSTTGKLTSSERADSLTAHESGDISPTLYNQLGGEDGLIALSDQFIIEIASDDRIRSRFAKTDISRFSRVMQEHMCELTDGPCEYSGDNIKQIHGGMNIRSSEFNAMVQALLRAMDSLHLPIGTQNQLLARLSVFRPDIVGH